MKAKANACKLSARAVAFTGCALYNLNKQHQNVGFLFILAVSSLYDRVRKLD